MNQNQKYDWAQPVEPRFQFQSHKGSMMLYSDAGEVIQPGDTTMVFSDGILQFKDGMETVFVSANKASKATILVEFHQKIVAVFMLSKDRGLLIKHLNEKGGHIPIAYKSSAVALLVLPDDEPFVGHIRVKALKDDQVDQSGSVRINSLENPRIHVPQAFA